MYASINNRKSQTALDLLATKNSQNLAGIDTK